MYEYKHAVCHNTFIYTFYIQKTWWWQHWGTCTADCHFHLALCTSDCLLNFAFALALHCWWNWMLVALFLLVPWLYNLLALGGSIEWGEYMGWCAGAHQCKRTFLNVVHTDVKVQCASAEKFECECWKVWMCTVNRIFGVVFHSRVH